MWVKINCVPAALAALALSVKASSKTLDPYLSNKQSPGFDWLNIYPMVLSSKGTTIGLSLFLIQAAMLLSACS